METTPCRAAEKMNRATGRPFQSPCWGERGPRLGTQGRFLELCPRLPLLPGLTQWGNFKEGLEPAPGKGRAVWCLCPWESLGSQEAPMNCFPLFLPQFTPSC